jgi:hypothetical protein
VVDVVVVDGGWSKQLASSSLVVDLVRVDGKVACSRAVPVERQHSLKTMVVMFELLLLLLLPRHLAHFEAATLTPWLCLCWTSRSVVDQ